MSPTRIYVTAEVSGEQVHCLLDSGCERLVIAHNLVPNAKLTPLVVYPLLSQPHGPHCSWGYLSPVYNRWS